MLTILTISRRRAEFNLVLVFGDIHGVSRMSVFATATKAKGIACQPKIIGKGCVAMSAVDAVGRYECGRAEWLDRRCR